MVAEAAPFVRELGHGRPVLVVHGGMSDESPWLRVAETVATRYRVVLIRRRLYRLELPVRPETAMAEQVAEVLAIAEGFGEPSVIVGHSSGAIVALEALAADPRPFAGAVLYEPPTPLADLPLGRPSTVSRARGALARRRIGRALQIFLWEAVEEPAFTAAVARALTLLPEIRRYVARQIDDLDTIVELGVRSDAYASIDRPIWLLTGERSPAHLRERCVRLASTVPHAELVTLPRVGHGANQSNPRQLGDLVSDFADLVLGVGRP